MASVKSSVPAIPEMPCYHVERTIYRVLNPWKPENDPDSLTWDEEVYIYNQLLHYLALVALVLGAIMTLVVLLPREKEPLFDKCCLVFLVSFGLVQLVIHIRWMKKTRAKKARIDAAYAALQPINPPPQQLEEGRNSDNTLTVQEEYDIQHQPRLFFVLFILGTIMVLLDILLLGKKTAEGKWYTLIVTLLYLAGIIWRIHRLMKIKAKKARIDLAAKQAKVD
jgi:hypothetical protein